MILGYIVFLSFTFGLTSCVLFLQLMYCYATTSKELELTSKEFACCDSSQS